MQQQNKNIVELFFSFFFEKVANFFVAYKNSDICAPKSTSLLNIDIDIDINRGPPRLVRQQ